MSTFEMQQSLAWHLKNVEQAEQEAAQIEREYQQAFHQFLTEHEDLAQRWIDARNKVKTARAVAGVIEDEIQSQLTELAEHHRMPEGISLRRFKKAEYDKRELIEAAIKYAPWLLTVDEERVQELVEAKSSSNMLDGNWVLSSMLTQWLPITVGIEYQVVFDHAALRAVAPSSELKHFYAGFDGQVYRLTPTEAYNAQTEYVGPYFDREDASGVASAFR